MRIRLLAPIGGHTTGDVLDHDDAAAEWLISAGLAAHVTDEPAPTTRDKTTHVQATRSSARRTSKRRAG